MKQFNLFGKDEQTEEKKIEFMISELTQIAAVALRAAKELENNEVKFV